MVMSIASKQSRSNHQPPKWNREFIFTENDFQTLRALVSKHTGISLSDSKRELVYSRLTRRLRELNIKSFSRYCELLQDKKNNSELVHFTDAVTTNLTSFYREPHHFQFIEKNLLPHIATSSSKYGRFRFWSAGCSTGEEPYSLAMTLKEFFPAINNYDIKILATDLASTVLATAEAGVYTDDRIKTVAPHRQKKWFTKDRNNPGTFHVNEELQKLITFRKLNLMEEWPMRGKFDAIMCRNVLIYFDKPTQRFLVDRFANLLKDDGYLFLGHSESLFKVSDRFNLVGQTIYRKIK